MATAVAMALHPVKGCPGASDGSGTMSEVATNLYRLFRAMHSKLHPWLSVARWKVSWYVPITGKNAMKPGFTSQVCTLQPWVTAISSLNAKSTGCAPRWRNNTLPITLREDKGSYFVHQNAARIPKYAFEPVFRASALLNPGFRFDNVDIVANRNSLRKLFDFCGGRVNSNFKVNLSIVKDTLFIERCEMSARELIRGSNRSGWGHNFEKAFTSFPSGADDSSGHHRVLCYSIGDLRCAVRFEVDACYDMYNAERNQVDSLLLQINALSLTESSTDRSCPPAMMPQSTAAELKSAQKPKSVGIYVPQLWFGRTPWLIIGYHTKGTFHSVKVTHTLPLFQNWEKDHQSELRRMVTLLHALRGAVRRNNGGNCTAVCEKTSNAKVIKIFQSTDRKRALPEELIGQFWASTC